MLVCWWGGIGRSSPITYIRLCFLVKVSEVKCLLISASLFLCFGGSPTPPCPPSHIPRWSMVNPRSDSYRVRPYHAWHAFAPAFLCCGFAARSFSSCLRLAARTLPRPCRSPPHSVPPLSPAPVCCVDPILRRAEPYPVRHASRLPSCFAGSRRGASLRACGLRLGLSRGRVVLRRTPGNLAPPSPYAVSIQSCAAPNLTPYDTRCACLLVLRVRGAEFLLVAMCRCPPCTPSE